MDPLEDVLALVGVTGHLSTRMTAGGDWAVRFGPPPGVKFNSVRRGHCVLLVDGVAEPVALAQGDAYLLTRPVGFTLCSDPAVPAVPAGPLFAAATDGVAVVGGDDVDLMGGRFAFGERARALLLDGLPPVVHLPAALPGAAAVRWSLDTIEAELRGRAVGSTLVAEHLALVMLIQVLRVHLDRDPYAATGWLAGLADPVVAAALRSMHARPEYPWSVAELARTASVSRSTLAARFKQIVGLGPLDYLTGWRIELASNRLRRADDTLATIPGVSGTARRAP